MDDNERHPKYPQPLIPITFGAEWNHQQERMAVVCKFKGQTYLEHFSRETWREFMAAIDTGPIRLGGLEVEMEGKGAIETMEAVRRYLKLVNEAFEKTGQTTFLRGT